MTVSAPTLGRPDVSIDGTVLKFEFTDSFAAGETRAYELRARHKSPRGPWAMGCHTVTESEAGSQAIALRTIIEFDSADLPGLTGGLMEDVALHEMGHALGIDGPLWKDLGMLENPSLVLGVEIEPAPDTHFTGPLAIAEFNSRGGLSYSGGKVPVENGAGAGQGGARDTHWRRSVLGTELMATGIYTLGANPLSSITIQALADLGYDVDKTQADQYWVSGVIGRDAPDFLPLGCGVGESRGVIEAPVVIEMQIERQLE